MNDLTELLKKYYGYGMNDELGLTESTSSDGGLGLDMGVQNKSLLGSDRKTNNTLSLMGLLGSPEALTGLGLISAGMKGQSIGEAALPSFVEGLKISSSVRAMTKEQEQQKAIDEFGSQVPEQYKPLFKAFPKETMKLLLTPKQPTLTSLEVKALEKVRAGLPLDAADKILIDKLKQGNPFNQIVGDIFSDPKIQEKIKEYASKNIDAQGKKSETTTQTPAAPADIKSTDIFKKYKEANPTVSDELLIDAIKKKFPNK
jgi:hypothetical protein